MKRFSMRRVVAAFLFALSLSFPFSTGIRAEKQPTEGPSPSLSLCAEEGSLSLSCESAILMEATTGTVLYTQNCDKALPPASVTKIMTLLLIMEAIDSGKIKLDDMVTASANAAGMGGSQIYLKEGEQMCVEDLLKSIIISSANDAAVAMAEHLTGDVDTFVRLMNQKAQELGMKSTHFENATGLDDTAVQHLTSARDIALMSRALIQHKTILKYSSIWMDTIRNGAFGLTNTNRLIRFYRGATGLKTGSTSKAGFCVSVTAERDGLSLICVIMGAESRDIRNAQATRLLDWGFANYALFRVPGESMGQIHVVGGTVPNVGISSKGFSCVLPKNELGKVCSRTDLPEQIPAPVQAEDCIGSTEYFLGNTPIGKSDIVANDSVDKINFFGVWKKLLSRIMLI